MRAVDWLLGREPKQEAKSVQWVGPQGTREIIYIGGQSADAEKLTNAIAYAVSAYAYTAIQWRAQRIAEPPLRVVRRDDEGGRDPVAHRLDDMLAEPSLDFDMGELQEITEVYRLTTGTCLWVRRPDVAGRDAQWMPFSGHEFETEAADGRIYGSFVVNTADGARRFDASEVVFFREMNPGSWRDPISKLDVALAQLNLGHQIDKTVRNVMANAIFPGGLVSAHPDWNPSDSEWEAYKAQIEAWHQGAKNAGRPLVLTGGTTFSATAMPLKDLLPGDMLDRIEATVSSVFGIPPVVLGWLVGLENSPWSHMPEARQMTYEETIAPRWSDTARAMTRQLLTPDERAAGLMLEFDLSDISAFSADDSMRAGTAASMRNEWTRNERRAYTGLPLLDDERGEFIEGPDQSSAPLPPAEPEPDAPVPDDIDDEPETDDGMINVEASAAAVWDAEYKSDPRALDWLIFDFSTKAGEDSFAGIVASALADQLAAIDRLAAKTLETKKIEDDSITLFLAELAQYLKGEGYRVMYRATLPGIRATSESAVKRVASAVRLSFAVLQDGLLDYAAEETGFLASVMGQTTADMVAKAATRTLESGGTIAEFREDLQESAAFTRDRAQLVARTETTRAWNGAQRRSLSNWQRSQPEGVGVVKTWLSSRDDRVRPEHVDLDGEAVGINETFPNGLDQPGEPNCRCTMTYTITEP